MTQVTKDLLSWATREFLRGFYRHPHVYAASIVSALTVAAFAACVAWVLNLPDAIDGGHMAADRLPALEAVVARNADETRESIQRIEITQATMAGAVDELKTINGRMLDVLLGRPWPAVATTNDPD